MKYCLASRFAAGQDFAGGVRARAVDKDGALRWNPATLGEVDSAKAVDLFAPLPEAEEWHPLT